MLEAIGIMLGAGVIAVGSAAVSAGTVLFLKAIGV